MGKDEKALVFYNFMDQKTHKELIYFQIKCKKDLDEKREIKNDMKEILKGWHKKALNYKH